MSYNNLRDDVPLEMDPRGDGNQDVQSRYPPNHPEVKVVEDVPNYMILSVFSLLCCYICAIPSVAYSASASALKVTEHYTEAKGHARTALILAIIAIVVGVILIIVSIIIVFATGYAIANNQNYEHYNGR